MRARVMKEMSKLALARVEKDLTQAKAAEGVGVDVGTFSRWEKGKHQPSLRHVKKLCDLFDKTAAELGLTPPEPEKVPSVGLLDVARHEESSARPVILKCFRDDIELRLRCLIDDWQHEKTQPGFCARLQSRMSQELKDFDAMTQEQPLEQHPDEGMNMARRDALRRLALFPIRVLGLDVALGTIPVRAPEEVLMHCAAGITACEHLAKGQHEDLTLAFHVLSTYLPSLKEIVDEATKHRKEAAQLVAQALSLKAMLSLHREGPKRAISSAKQAVIYSRESNNVPLQLAILRRLAWMYTCDKQEEKALETILQAQTLLQQQLQRGIPIPSITQSAIYSRAAQDQARNGRNKDALAVIHRAYDAFHIPKNETIATYNEYNDYDYYQLLMYDGQTHYHLGQYDKALEVFAQAVDPETLVARIPPSSKRVYIELINHQTLASLKSPAKDMELSIKLWTAGIKGAVALHSKQRLSEAVTAYDIMQALWSGDKRIKDLRNLIQHW